MIFEVVPEQIAALSDTDLRILIGFLAEQEARKAGLSPSGVTYGGHQNAPDGGIDVRAEFASGTISGFIPKLSTGYQVKAEDFSASAVTKEMRPKGVLRPSIIKLAQASGAYIIVSSKGSVSDTSLEDRKKAMLDALKDEPKAAGLLVDFYDRRRISTWVNQQPGIIPWVQSKTSSFIAGWKPFDDWSSSPGKLDEEYIADDAVRIVSAKLKEAEPLNAVAGIEELRKILHKPGSSVRLVGLSGVGKTRLVQALFDERIGADALNKHDAVYADLSDSPSPIPSELLSHLINFGHDSILIVDNCGVDLHKKLITKINKEGAQVRLITVEYDISDDEPEHTDTYKLEPASKDTIKKVVKRRYQSLTDTEISTISEFSEGNARIALALADTASHGDSLANLKDSELIERLFHQKHEKDPALLRTAKALSLVYSFDGETLDGDDAELPRLAKLIGISVEEVHAHVAELVRRQLIQKRSRWRALLPHALAHKLAAQALEDFMPQKVQTALVEGAPKRLLKSFSRRLGCLHSSDEAKTVIEKWLAPGGILGDLKNASKTQYVVLENVAPVNQSSVMKALHDVLDVGDPIPDASSFYETAASLFWAFAYEPEYFDSSVDGLLKLNGKSEPSPHARSAASYFESLFYMYLSGTHAKPEQRIKYLKRLVKSNDPNREELVFEALDAMLECSHFTSSHNFEFGTRKRDYGYRPKTYAEQWNWYHQVYDFAHELSLQPSFNARIRQKIASAFSPLARYAGPPEKLIELAEKFAADGGWSQGWASARKAARQAEQDGAAEAADVLKTLSEKLSPKSLADRIDAYVLPARWGALDIAEVDFDDDKKYEKAERLASEAAEAIGAELAASEDDLNKHLLPILSADQGRSMQTAKGLGQSVTNPKKTWHRVLDTIKKHNPKGHVGGFLAGFLQGVSVKNPEIANELLDECLSDEMLQQYVVYLQAVIGLDELGIERIKKAAELASVPTITFRTLAGGRTMDDVAVDDLNTILKLISEKGDGLHTAIDIFRMRLFSKRSDKKELLEDEREIGRWLLKDFDFTEKDNELPGNVTRIAEVCLLPGQDEALVRELCERLKSALLSHRVYGWGYGKLVSFFMEAFPEVALSVFVDRDDEDVDHRRKSFKNFRDRQPCPLGNMDEERLIAWAEENPDMRYQRLAQVIRPWSSSKNDDEAEPGTKLNWNTRALAILRHAPNKQTVLRAFVRTFRPSSWGGSYADVLASRTPLLDELISDEDGELAEIAKGELEKLSEDIAVYRKREEDESRNQDESFEW